MTKQYLLLCTEEGRKTIAAFAKGIDFIEVQGINVNNENTLTLLATPVIPSVNPVVFAPDANVHPEPVSAQESIEDAGEPVV